MIKRKEFIHTPWVWEVHETEVNPSSWERFSDFVLRGVAGEWGKKSPSTKKKRKKREKVFITVSLSETLCKINKFLESIPKENIISIQEQDLERSVPSEVSLPGMPINTRVVSITKFVIFYREEEK